MRFSVRISRLRTEAYPRSSTRIRSAALGRQEPQPTYLKRDTELPSLTWSAYCSRITFQPQPVIRAGQSSEGQKHSSSQSGGFLGTSCRPKPGTAQGPTASTLPCCGVDADFEES